MRARSAVTHVFAGIPVSDFAERYAWYAGLFGRAADMFPHDREAVWHLSSSASVYVVDDAERAGNGLITLAVADLNACEEHLRAHGFALVAQAVGTAPRRLTVTDEDGNRITFFEAPAVSA